MTDWILEKLSAIAREISVKIWNIGKRLVPLFALVEAFIWLFGTKLRIASESTVEAIAAVFESLSLDLSLPVEYSAKINAVIPLYEGVQFLLAYFSLVLILTGFKWVRNLIPGLS